MSRSYMMYIEHRLMFLFVVVKVVYSRVSLTDPLLDT